LWWKREDYAQASGLIARADNGKVDITEVLSPGQKAEDLEEKYSAALGDRMGSFQAVRPTKQMCTGSRIAREIC
jgi:hypothetical protein